MNETCPCCGAPMFGSDHCPHCGCEEFERFCEANFETDQHDESCCQGCRAVIANRDCPVLCWQFRHFDYCRHTDEPDDIDRSADEERRHDR